MSQITLRRTIFRLGPLQIAIILLAVVAALIHLDRAIMTSLPAGHFAGAPGGHPPGSRYPGHFTGHFQGPPPGPSILTVIPLQVLFYLNFVGFITLTVALYLPLLRRFQRIIRWTLIGYTLLTILAWVWIAHAQFNMLSYISEPVEVALIILLLIEDQRARLAKGRPAS
jgi:peptidoglycan/LPS O-acetylase OafA/YrhL